jgi:hypothetical protein
MKLKIKFLTLTLLCCSVGVLCSTLQVYSQKTNFRYFLEERLAKDQRKSTVNGKSVVTSGIRLEEICPVNTDVVAARVFADYGAIFIAGNGVLFPTKCVFVNENEVFTYQNSAKPKAATLGGTSIELQEPAMDALLAAVKEAAQKNLKITPRGGSIAARRSYEDTARLWNSRFNPGLAHWQKMGKISRQDAEAAKAMPINQQVAQVLQWESKKLWFSTDLSKSILYSVAAPGASQHIFMLALDVEQFGNKQVRDILAKHGWFQTVLSDLPHFTYLGVEESSLTSLGLKCVPMSGQKFWIPNLN